MVRTIIERYEMTFDYHDHDIAGYLIGGELSTEEPDAETKENFCGDWSEVTLANIWSMVHNGDRSPVTFWKDNKEFLTYYPHHSDDTRFRVIRCRLGE